MGGGCADAERRSPSDVGIKAEGGAFAGTVPIFPAAIPSPCDVVFWGVFLCLRLRQPTANASSRCGSKESWRGLTMERQEAFSGTAVGQQKRTNMPAEFENQSVFLSGLFLLLHFFFFFCAFRANLSSEATLPLSKNSKQHKPPDFQIPFEPFGW